MTISTNINEQELALLISFINENNLEFNHSMTNGPQSSFYFNFNGYVYFIHYFNGNIDVLNKIRKTELVNKPVEVKKEEPEVEVIPEILFADIVTLYSDGACQPNPGEAGSGISVYYDDAYQYSLYGCYVKDGTNNIAELNGFKQAMIIAKKYLEGGAQKVVIKTDSKYSISCLTEWLSGWLKNNWKTSAGKPVKNKELIQDIYAVYKEIKDSISILHVNGHVGIEGNELADRMSVFAIKNKNFNLQRCNFNIQEILKMPSGG